MAADFARPNLGNKIKEDIPGLYDILQALATGATQGTVNTPTGTLNFYIDGNNNLKIQRLDASGAWVDIAQLKNDADTLDGFHATTSTTKNTIPVRDSNGAVPGSITGNAPTATKAQQLTDINPVAMGGTGASTAADARTNLGVPPISHASVATTYGVSTDKNYGHAKATSTTPKKASADGTVGNETSAFARGDHQHPREVFLGTCTTAVDTYAKEVSIPDYVQKDGSFLLLTYTPATTRSVTITAPDGTTKTSIVTLISTTEGLTLSVNSGIACPLVTSGGQIIGTELIQGGTYLFVLNGANFVYVGGTKLSNERIGSILSSATKGTAPDTAIDTAVNLVDKTGAEYGGLHVTVGNDLSTSVTLKAHPGNEAGTPTAEGNLTIGYDKDGNAYTSVPTPAAQNSSANIANTEWVNNNAVMLYGNQTIEGAKTFASPLTCNEVISGKRLTLNNGTNHNLDFVANNVSGGDSGAYISGASMEQGKWKQIALVEDATSIADNKAAAWSRDRQMAPDGTRWRFYQDTDYTAPHNGFLRFEEWSGRHDAAVYTLNINGGTAATLPGPRPDDDWGHLAFCYPIRAGWTWRLWRSSGNSWPDYMEYIQADV